MIDVTERKQAAVAVESALPEHLIATLYEEVVVLDKNLRVLSTNRTFYAIFDTAQEAAENPLSST